MKNLKKKSVWMLALMVLLLTATVSGTIAYIAASTQPVVNTFTPGKNKIEVDEDWDEETKKNVTIANTGTIDVYVRAAIVVTWKDNDGNVYGVAPVKGTDYSLVLGTTGWSPLQNDGYYYHKGAVAVNGATSVLITECKQLKEAPADYKLSVEILASSIQTEPEDAIEELWGADKLELVKN